MVMIGKHTYISIKRLQKNRNMTVYKRPTASRIMCTTENILTCKFMIPTFSETKQESKTYPHEKLVL